MAGIPLGIEGTWRHVLQKCLFRYPVMDDDLLTVREAARRLGVQPATLYDWLSRSDYGLFEIRGQRVTVDYLQGGPRGQGNIRIEAGEVSRLKDLMRVKPMVAPVRRPPIQRTTFPGIAVKLGRPQP